MRLKLQTTINDFATNFLQINDKRSAAKTDPENIGVLAKTGLGCGFGCNRFSLFC